MNPLTRGLLSPPQATTLASMNDALNVLGIRVTAPGGDIRAGEWSITDGRALTRYYDGVVGALRTSSSYLFFCAYVAAATLVPLSVLPGFVVRALICVLFALAGHGCLGCQARVAGCECVLGRPTGSGASASRQGAGGGRRVHMLHAGRGLLVQPHSALTASP